MISLQVASPEQYSIYMVFLDAAAARAIRAAGGHATWFLFADSRGDAFSRFRLGWLYVRGGPGLARDLDQDLKNIETAVVGGYLRAFAFLGAIHEGGYGIARNEAKARDFYASGAALGDRRSQYRLALAHYRCELGLAKDVGEALLWFTAAAEQGDGDAQAFLAGMIERGEEVDRDPVEAMKWALLACQAEGEPGAEVRARMLAELSAEQVDDAEERAAVWLDIKSRGAISTPELRDFLLRQEQAR